MTVCYSLAPKAVDTWKTTLVSSGKKKIASGIAHPVENADLFTEGWEEALEREAAHAPKANGGAPLIDLDGNDGEEDEGEEESEEE
jgi:coatomer subunit beta'